MSKNHGTGEFSELTFSSLISFMKSEYEASFQKNKTQVVLIPPNSQVKVHCHAPSLAKMLFSLVELSNKGGPSSPPLVRISVFDLTYLVEVEISSQGVRTSPMESLDGEEETLRLAQGVISLHRGKLLKEIGKSGVVYRIILSKDPKNNFPVEMIR